MLKFATESLFFVHLNTESQILDFLRSQIYIKIEEPDFSFEIATWSIWRTCKFPTPLTYYFLKICCFLEKKLINLMLIAKNYL